MVINLFKSTISKDLVKVAGEGREKSRPMRIRLFFFSSTGSQTKVILPNPSPMYGFSFHFTECTKTKQKHFFMCPGKSFKDVGNISNCLLPTSVHSVLCDSFGWGRV